jgi:inner membrane transporter RhtA
LKSSIFFAPALVIASMISLTLGASIAKTLFPLAGPSGTTVIRLGLAAMMLVIVWKPWRRKLTRAELKLILAYGVGLGVMNLTFYEAISRLPIGLAIAIEFLGPLGVAFFYSRTKLDVVWALLALLGIILILPLSTQQAPIDLVGVGFALIAAVAWAFYMIIGRKAGSSIHAGTVTTFGLLFGCLTVLPIGGMKALSLLQHLEFIPSALAVGLLSSAIPYSLEMMALKRLDSKNFGILLSLEPAIGAMSAYFVLSERLTITQLVAVACVMTASAGSTITSHKKSKNEVKNQAAVP